MEMDLLNKCLLHIYLNEIDSAIDCINNPTFNYTLNNNQLLRELHCGRLTVTDTLKVYSKLVEKHNYLMTKTDLEQLSWFQSINATKS